MLRLIQRAAGTDCFPKQDSPNDYMSGMIAGIGIGALSADDVA